MLHIELRNHLDEVALAEILALIAEARQIEGHDPVGEHKASHLAVGARDWVGILAYEHARLVGYAHARWNAPDALPRLAVEVVVHPHWYGRGVARHLLDETRSVLGRAGGGVLYLWVHRVEDRSQTLAAQMGFRVQRELAFMAADLHAPSAPPRLPEGVSVRPYGGPAEDQAFLAVNNAAFPAHPENGDWTAADFAARRALPWFDPSGLLLAWRGAELLGFHWTKWHAHETEQPPAHGPEGEVYVLAVAPAAQVLGLGRALLDAGLHHLYRRGCRRVVLYVDEANGPAKHLYASRGFVTRYREVCYSEEVWPVVDHQAADLLRPA